MGVHQYDAQLEYMSDKYQYLFIFKYIDFSL
ncbi:hypothetical protein J2W95_003018 [Flavobacterium granuli]|uniref:Uncharacterized protein n=1 Tax=Flavobacterium granuli TaxID=280093 RepID=A0ABU1S5J1_9FLAO|nr:hypothetical protein [Flavobacterium granuli]